MFDKNLTLEEFFYENKDGFDTLVGLHENSKDKFLKRQQDASATYESLLSLYTKFKDGFHKKQEMEIAAYHALICSKTGTNQWGLYCYGRVLYIYCKGKVGEHRIGIECGFKDETFENPLGEFHISVASWEKPTFDCYEQDLENEYPYIDKEIRDGRAFRLIEKLNPNNPDAIIAALENTYKTLNRIIAEHKHE